MRVGGLRVSGRGDKGKGQDESTFTEAKVLNCTAEQLSRAKGKLSNCVVCVG